MMDIDLVIPYYITTTLNYNRQLTRKNTPNTTMLVISNTKEATTLFELKKLFHFISRPFKGAFRMRTEHKCLSSVTS